MEKGHEDWLCVGVKRGPVWRGIPKEIVSLIQVPESRPDSRRSRRVRRGIPKEIVSQILPKSRPDSRRSRRVRRGIPKEIVSQILPESRPDSRRSRHKWAS